VSSEINEFTVFYAIRINDPEEADRQRNRGEELRQAVAHMCEVEYQDIWADVV
jgi:hypothetical protein